MRSLFTISFFLFLSFTTSLFATELFTGQPKEIFADEINKPWAFVERHVDPHPRFPYEPHHPKGVHIMPEIRQMFGTDFPESNTFLLHAAPGWDEATKSNPILCLPGAFDNATLRYGLPYWGHEDPAYDKPGLAVYLARRGYAVFGITFAHAQGCNIHQGEHVANAIKRIRMLQGRENDPSFSVTLVTYSKGIFAARCYVESACNFYRMKHLTSFRNDVSHCVFQVGPIAGMDSPYRYYAYPLLASGRDEFPPMPQPADGVLKYGTWRKTSHVESIYSEYWIGTRQCMYDLRKIGIDYGVFSWTPMDLNSTMKALVDGGKTLLLKCRGIDDAAQAGGNLVERLNECGLPKGVKASLVAGTHPVLYTGETFLGFRVPLGAELTDTSDGAVFLKSVFYTKGLTASGAKVVGKKSWKLNHVDISRSKGVYSWILGQLELN